MFVLQDWQVIQDCDDSNVSLYTIPQNDNDCQWHLLMKIKYHNISRRYYLYFILKVIKLNINSQIAYNFTLRKQTITQK